MERSARARPITYVKYAIPIVIIIVILAVFLSLRSRRDREAETGVTEEAIEHIETVKEKAEEPIDIEKADHFVDAETPLSKKDRTIVVTTPKDLLDDQSLSPESPIKIIVEKERTVITTPRELLKNKTIGPRARIMVVEEEGSVVVTTPEELLQNQSITLDTPIKIILKEEEMVTTTPGRLLADKSMTPETPIKLVLEEPEEMVTVSRLLQVPEGQEATGTTFFVHTVTDDDVQGIWGIIHHGLTKQFRKGIPMPEGMSSGGEPILSLDLPRYADEQLENGRSSFLGGILDSKTRESYVYNYRNGRMGKNPDYIAPGQELVVIQFSQEDLVQIYRYFAQNQ